MKLELELLVANREVSFRVCLDGVVWGGLVLPGDFLDIFSEEWATPRLSRSRVSASGSLMERITSDDQSEAVLLALCSLVVEVFSPTKASHLSAACHYIRAMSCRRPYQWFCHLQAQDPRHVPIYITTIASVLTALWSGTRCGSPQTHTTAEYSCTSQYSESRP
jgi:hypothetical protein